MSLAMQFVIGAGPEAPVIPETKPDTTPVAPPVEPRPKEPVPQPEVPATPPPGEEPGEDPCLPGVCPIGEWAEMSFPRSLCRRH